MEEEEDTPTFGFGGKSNDFGGQRNNKRAQNGRFQKQKQTKRQKIGEEAAPTPIVYNLEGARLIDIGHFQKQLVCSKCNLELSVRGIKSETILGLASVFKINCANCGAENRVQTSKMNPSGSYNANIVAVLGSHDGGFGNTQMRAFLSTMNAPSMTDMTYDKIQKKIGPKTLECANQSCLEAIIMEKEFAKRKKMIYNCDFCDSTLLTKHKTVEHMLCHLKTLSELENVEICALCGKKVESKNFFHHIQQDHREIAQNLTCPYCDRQYSSMTSISKHLLYAHLQSFSYFQKCKLKCNEKHCEDDKEQFATIGITGSSDGCWMKRGNGYCNDSHSGFVSVIGQESGKVLDFEVKQNYCKGCALKGKQCRQPTCSKNWSGSAKSMESGSVVEMITKTDKLNALGVHFESLVCDGDASVAAGIREATKGACDRVADVTHALKHLSNQLYAIRNKQITPGAIDYLKRMAGCAIKTNKDNPPGISEALKSIPLHAFGDHSLCNPSWCTRQIGSSSKHLEHEIDVPGSATYTSNLAAVQKVFGKLEAKSSELAPNGSTQGNESLNSVVTSKAPKRLDFSSSRSIRFRCAAAVLQKNVGVDYTLLLTIRKENQISPGKWTKEYKEKLAKQRAKLATSRKTTVYKKRRRQLLFAKKNKTQRNEKKEGTTYKSGMHFDTASVNEVEPGKTLPAARNGCQAKSQLISFKPPSSRKLVGRIPSSTFSNSNVVYFDVETTGLRVGVSEIIQMSAKYHDQDSFFNCYITPHRGISKVITELTGISMSRGKMYHNGMQVNSKSMSNALTDFINFLASGPTGHAVLVAHNAQFDARFLLDALTDSSLLDPFKLCCTGFVDTLAAARSILPKSPSGPGDHKISGLLNYFYGEVDICLHDSSADVLALEGIVRCLVSGLTELEKFSFDLEEYMTYQISTSTAKEMASLLKHGISSSKLLTLASKLNLSSLYTLAKTDLGSFKLEIETLFPNLLTADQLSAVFHFLSGT